MSDKYTAEYLRRQSACVHIAIEGEPAKDISEGLRAGADYADRLAAYERNTIQRDESVPHDAIAWHKGDEFCHWIHLGPIRWEIAEPGQVQKAPSPIMDTTDAPDLRPDTEGPITLPIVDADTP